MESFSDEEISEVEFDIDVNYIQPYMFEPLANDEDSEVHDDQVEDVDTHRIGNVDWCTCGHCVPMFTGKESVCCLEIPNTDLKINSSNQCIVEEEEFLAVCINRAVIKTAMVVFLNDNGPIANEPKHETLRYIAYRQWTAWIHGNLGKKFRIPLPSCAVSKIREAFPSETGVYKGFEYARQLLPD